ncbi:unnamed protein product [Ectocarpus fasciculatus]
MTSTSSTTMSWAPAARQTPCSTRASLLPQQVNTVLTVPMMRTWCKANDTTLFIAPAHDLYVGHQRPGAAAEVPPTDAPWPAGLRREIKSLDDGKTNDLPISACLAIGAPVVLHKSPQYVTTPTALSVSLSLTHVRVTTAARQATPSSPFGTRHSESSFTSSLLMTPACT